MRRRRQVESIRRAMVLLLLLAGPATVSPLVAGAEVRCRPLGPWPGGSTMARCFAADYDLSEGMVYVGWALAAPATGDRYGRVQEQAKRSKRGLWRGRFVAPWEWSVGKRLPEEGGG